MPLRRWMPMLACACVLAQEAAPFPEERRDPWIPAWELILRGDRFIDPESPGDSFRRADAQLRLRWSWDWGPLSLEAGTRSALGSDGNRDNVPRWDNQPSNGSQLDLAHVEAGFARPGSFGTLALGLQEVKLLVSPGAWDRNLRLLGAGGSIGLRSGDGWLQEAGVRFATGRVHTILGGDVTLGAAQAVLRVDTGPVGWTADLARWDLRWDAGVERQRALPGNDRTPRQRLILDALGAAVHWYGPFPLEARAFRYRNPDTREDSEEAQVSAGSRERVWWPQFTCAWQRLSSTGTLYPVNGDEWWFYRSARGPRFEVALALPGRWLAALAYLRQKADWEDYSVTRRMLTVTKRF